MVAGGMSPGFAAGTVLDGRYRLDRPLADGGMGTVWVGHQINLDREVAIKSLLVANPELRARLRQEALALARLHHPAVVSVYDYGETPDGVPFIVMELLRGPSLGARLEAEGPWGAAAAARLMLVVLDGLAAAHAAGIIHRDIKPENVLLVSDGQGEHPKLLDFGIAWQARAGDRLTENGGIVGTPEYMAPEQLRGAIADERTDVWGVGVLLYHLVTGRSPFEAADMWGVAQKVFTQPPPSPRDIDGIDGALWQILTDALRKIPDERIGSASELRNRLSRWLDTQAGRAVVSPGRTPNVEMQRTLGVNTLPRAPGASATPLPQDLAIHPSSSLDDLVRKKFGS